MLHFDAQAVRRALPWDTLIRALRRAFVQDCVVPGRHSHAIAEDGNGGTALLMPAWRPGGSLGVKTVTIFPGNGALGIPGIPPIDRLLVCRLVGRLVIPLVIP